MVYYIDPSKRGTEHTFSTLEEAACHLQPGDTAMLAVGMPHAPSVLTGVAGTAEAPIVILGGDPEGVWIDGGDGSGLVLRDCAHVKVDGISSRGSGRKYHNKGGTGFLMEDCQNVILSHCAAWGYRHAGISVRGGQDNVISYVLARDNGANGIISEPSSKGYGKRLTVTHCKAINNPGDTSITDNHSGNGIMISAVEGALVEYCEAAYNGWDMNNDEFNGPVGIWTACHAHNVIIDHCISHDNRTQWGRTDGGGYDFDGGTCDCVIQYSYSYNNDGSGFLICQYTGGDTMVHNIVRYSVSVNDGRGNHKSNVTCFDGGGPNPAHTAYLYHNLLYNSKKRHIVTGHYDHTVFVHNRMELEGGGDFLEELGPECPGTTVHLEGKDCPPMLFYRNAYVDRDGASTFAKRNSLQEWSGETGQEANNGIFVGESLEPKAYDFFPLEDPDALDPLLKELLGDLWMEPCALHSVLETPRLLLRPFTMSDLPQFRKLLEMPEVPGWYMQRENPMGLFQYYLDQYNTMDIAKGAVCLGIFDKDTGALYGAAGAGAHDDLKETEIFFNVLPEARGKGYAKEAAAAVAQWALAHYGLESIIGTAETDNTASQKVLESIGFTLEGEKELLVHITQTRHTFRAYRFISPAK